MVPANVLDRSPASAKSYAGLGFLPVPAFRPETIQESCQAFAQDQPLDGLSGSSVARRFRAWHGRSGRRYICSVFVVGAAGDDLDRLPLENEAVVIAVRRKPDGRLEKLWVGRSGGALPTDRALVAAALTPGCEMHIHLLALDAAERQAIVEDLIDA